MEVLVCPTDRIVIPSNEKEKESLSMLREQQNSPGSMITLPKLMNKQWSKYPSTYAYDSSEALP